MPRWISSVPVSKPSSRYLDRRCTERSRPASPPGAAPRIIASRSSGIGQRSWANRRMTFVSRWPTKASFNPLHTISTSGSSGTSGLPPIRPPRHRRRDYFGCRAV
jgi:hypothetical protein